MDWSEPFLEAQKALKAAENSLALKRYAEALVSITKTRERLSAASLLVAMKVVGSYCQDKKAVMEDRAP